jgi:hypothetical protein
VVSTGSSSTGRAGTAAAGEAAYLVDDPDDPSRKLIRQVPGAVNEYEDCRNR